MFLTLREVLYEKSKFFLLVSLIFIISYLVFFLSSLAFGLASSYSDAVNQMNAESIAYTKESNNNINMSFIKFSDIESKLSENTAPLVTIPVIIRNTKEDSDQNLNAFVFASTKYSFIYPDIYKGSYKDNANLAVVDVSLKKKGFDIGDTIYFAGDFDDYLIISGFSKNTKFQVAPVIFTNFEFTSKFKNIVMENSNPKFVNAIISKDKNLNLKNSAIKTMEIQDFIFELPGYKAQVLTFSIMIIFLILASAMIIGIFIFVLTVQKTQMFGIMKAQGIPDFYLFKFVIYKTLFITFTGVFLALTLILITGIFLPSQVPFKINYLIFTLVVITVHLFAFLGAMFSVRVLSKIDPLIALKS